MLYFAIDSVFQPPMFMISSTTVPVRNVREETPTRQECIIKWLGSSAAHKKMVLLAGRHTGC